MKTHNDEPSVSGAGLEGNATDNSNASADPPPDANGAGKQVFADFSNSECLRGLLGRELTDGERFWVAGFHGNPANSKEARWGGAAYTLDSTDTLTATNNSYFSVSLFAPEAKGRKQANSLGVFDHCAR